MATDQPYNRHSFADKIATANEAQRQKNLSPQARTLEQMQQLLVKLQNEVNDINLVLDKMHFSGTLGITGNARTGFIANFPDARVTCVNGVARLIVDTNG